MSEIDRLIEWHRAHLGRAAHPGVPPQPTKRLVVVTCMDFRLVLEEITGLAFGEAQVLRNAGGVVTEDVIRSLMLSQRRLGPNAVMVIQHTGCALHRLDEEALVDEVIADTGERPPFALLSFDHIAERVRISLATLEQSPFVTGEFRGFVLDVETGLLEEVVRV
jgi:carbonic anhydrase